MTGTRDGRGWSALFATAFSHSRNAMVLLDADRWILDANAAFVQLTGHPRARLLEHRIASLVKDGPLLNEREWRDAMAQGRFTGEVTLLHADGSEIDVQWGAATEVATGRRLVLVAALTTSRWGGRFRRTGPDHAGGALSRRELEVVRLIALGASGPEIADELHISHDTVRTHARNAMAKLGARSRAQLAAKAVAESLVRV